MSFCAFTQLLTTFIFFSVWNTTHVKWDNSWNTGNEDLTLHSMLSRILIQGERSDQRPPEHQIIPYRHFIVQFLYCSPWPLWATVLYMLVKCYFLNISPCFWVYRISNYDDSRFLWHDLWGSGCFLINILCLIRYETLKKKGYSGPNIHRGFQFMLILNLWSMYKLSFCGSSRWLRHGGLHGLGNDL